MYVKKIGGLLTSLLSRSAIVAAALVCFTLSFAHAQTAGTASVQGTVTDPTGASVPTATVTLTSTETGVSRSTTSNSSGLYSLPNVPVGPYSITIVAAGFRNYTQKGVLEVGSNVQINAPLSIGSASDQVTVESSGVALETEESSYKQVIDSKRILEMPLNGRQPTQLILISGAAVNAPGNDIIGSKSYASSVNIAIAGGQGNTTNYQLDGADYNDSFTNVNLPIPFPDALREFSVETNSTPARNGLHPGGIVNAVTRSGTNQWHGSAFEFIRNNIINANNFFSTTVDTYRQNQFGGTLGGKIITDKLFIFGGYQRTNVKQNASSKQAYLPTAANILGDFSQSASKGVCPTAVADWGTGAGQKTLLDPIDGSNISGTKQIPLSHLNAQALNLVKYLPTTTDPCGLVNYAIPFASTEDQALGRVDYSLSQKHQMFARFFLAQYNQPAYFSPTNILVTQAYGNQERVMSLDLGETFIITPKIVNTFHAVGNRRRDNRGPAPGINFGTLGVNIDQPQTTDLRLNVSNKFATGCGTCSPGHFNSNTIGVADDVDWLLGKHQIAFGGEFLRTQLNMFVAYLQNGNPTFNGQFSGASNGNKGEPIIDFLTGQMSAFSQSRAQQVANRESIPQLYGQDTVHFNQRLTLSYGLRWEPVLFPYDRYHRGSTFDLAAFEAGTRSTIYPNAPAGTFYYGEQGVTPNFTSNSWKNLSPRVGITFDPFGDGKTVFRAGGSLNYDSPNLFTAQRLTSNPPYVNEIDLTTGPYNFTNPYAGYPGGNPFPGVYPPNATAPYFQQTLYILLPKTMKANYITQWTASMQHEFAHGWLFEMNYLGNESTHMLVGKAINQGVYIPGNYTGPGSCGGLAPGTPGFPSMGAPCSSTKNTNSRTVLSRISPTQGLYYSPSMTLINDDGTASYNGLITSVQRRMGNLNVLANYTWSHCIDIADNQGDVTSNQYEDPTRPRLNRANCGFDVRHVVNASVVAAAHFSSLHGITSALVNNWQIAPLLRIQSGLPINITSGVDNSFTGLGLDRPNLVNPNGVYTGNKITQSASGNRFYLSKAAFTQNAIGTIGNLGRNAFRGPKYVNLDASLIRTFPLYDRLAMDLRLEAFNVLNHPNIQGFTTALNSGTFGYATSAAAPRIFQGAVKFNF